MVTFELTRLVNYSAEFLQKFARLSGELQRQEKFSHSHPNNCCAVYVIMKHLPTQRNMRPLRDTNGTKTARHDTKRRLTHLYQCLGCQHVLRLLHSSVLDNAEPDLVKCKPLAEEACYLYQDFEAWYSDIRNGLRAQ